MFWMQNFFTRSRIIFNFTGSNPAVQGFTSRFSLAAASSFLKNTLIKVALVFLLAGICLKATAQNSLTVTVLTDPTTNGTANPSIFDNTAGLAVIGFKMVVVGSPNINNIYINTNVPTTYNLDNIFTSATRNLVKVSSANYATATVLSASSGVVNTASSGGFDQYSINFNSVISAGTYYYFLVLKSTYMNTIPSTIQFSMNSASAFTFNSPSATVSVSSPTTTLYTLYSSLYWRGSADINWDNASNWYTLSGGTYSNANRVPNSNDIVYIGYSYTGSNKNPTLSSTSPTVNTIYFGTVTGGDGTCRLIVNGQTLTVTSTIYKDHTNNNTKTIATLSGTGTINVSGITIGNSNVPINSSPVQQDSTVINSRINSLHITGDVTLISNASPNGTACYFPAFNIDANTVTLDGTIITQNNANAVSSTYVSTYSFPVRGRFDVNHSSSTNVLILNNIAPVQTLATYQGVDFNDQGTTNSTVIYNSPSDGQIVATSADGIGSVGGNYQNLTLSGAGKKTFHGTSVSVAGTLTTGNGAVDLNTYDPTITVTGSWVNSTTVTQGSGNISVGGALTNSGTLTLGSANLTVSGNYTNSGTYTQSTGTTTFNGSSPTLNDSGNGTMFNKVAFSGGGTALLNSGNFSVSSTGILTLSNSTTLNANGHLTLNSDASGSAGIATIPTGSSITNNVSVQRYFQGSATYDATKARWIGRNYRIISSPVNTGTLVGGNYIYALNYIVGATAGLTTTANSTTNAFVTGATGGSTSAGNPTLYLYRENIVPSGTSFTSGNFKGITNITSPSAMSTTDAGSWTIPVGNGVFFFYRGNATSYAARTTGTYIAPENTTFTTTGTLNQGTITVKDWFTPASGNLSYTTATANTAVRGYNMVGNPYASSIDWNTYFSGGITQTNILPTIYVFNPVSNQYDTYITTSSSAGTSTGNASKIIASGQGFFVRASAASPVLTFTEAAKVTTQVTGSNLLMGTPAGQPVVLQEMRLKLILDSLNYDDIVIGFRDGTSEKFNGYEDSEYLPGNAPLVTLTSLSSDGVNLAINFLPFPKLQKRVVKLNVGVTRSGTYTLKQTEMLSIPDLYEVWLMDKFKKDSLDIRHNTNYVFEVNKADTLTFGKNRFEIVIRQRSGLGVHVLDFAAKKASDGAQTTWKTENEQNYTNFTVERSIDNGQTFIVLGGFASTGAGNYSLLDKDPYAGIDQYRLKVEDLNGTITYSKVVSLNYAPPGKNNVVTNIDVFPNPASNLLNLAITSSNNAISANFKNISTPLNLINSPFNTNYSPVSSQSFNSANTNTGSYLIEIVNSSGAVIKTATSTQSLWQTDVSKLTPGTYIIQVVNNADKTVVGKSVFVKL
jgi:hypothetical protein